MYGRRPCFRHGSSAAGLAPEPQQHPPAVPSLDPNLHLQNLNFHLQNPVAAAAAAFSQPFNPFLQNLNLSFPSPNFQFTNPGFRPQNLPASKPGEPVEGIDRAVVKARRELLTAGESVSAWKVSQSALRLLQAVSWESLGYRMQEVPSLYSLIVTEGKINAFIHCFVGVRRITSLYDLEVSICKNEGVEQFEELELGPLVRHPLIVHYFSLSSDAAGVFKITSEEIVSYLIELMDNQKTKNIMAEQLLDFIAKQRAVTSREKLGVRIQSLGFHITSIQEAKKIEDFTLTRCIESLRETSNKRVRKRPLLSYQKKQLDERYSAISQRVNSFSSVHSDFHGKHIRFISSSSEDDDSDDYNYEDKKDGNEASSHCKSSSQNISSDRVSKCPYPSASEEMVRLGLKGETDITPSTSGNIRYKKSSGPVKKKRRSENLSCATPEPSRDSKRGEVKPDLAAVRGIRSRELCNGIDGPVLCIGCDSLRIFITTWKEACREHAVDEVFERMLQFYNITARRRKKMKLMFSSYPYVGLLNVAVASIQRGMWDSIYDAFQNIEQNGLDPTVSENYSEYESIDVEPTEKDVPIITKESSEITGSVAIEDIIGKITSYFGLDQGIVLGEKSTLGEKCMFLRKLCDCEGWVAKQFSVKEFGSLGYGDLFTFLEKYASILPSELYKCCIGEFCDKSPLEASMLQQQLVVFLAQASNSLWEDETMSKQKISGLLMRQFPLVSFKVMEYASMEYFLDIIREKKNSATSKSVLFSMSLSGMFHNGQASQDNEAKLLRAPDIRNDISQNAGILGPVTSKDALDVLLRAPMLSDLIEWSHWDLIFAPSLGTLVEWLLNEVNTKELLCLVTKDGKIIRIDNSVTVDSFLEVSLQGSSFQTAVKLLSLFSLYGGIRHVPLALLKMHARRAFEVIFKNSKDNVKGNDGMKYFMHERASCGEQIPGEGAIYNTSGKMYKYSSEINEAMPYASRFILECLRYLPSEARNFAADVLLAGLQSVIKDAPAAILSECKQTEQRLMIHEVGFSLGIMEWINDYHAFCESSVADSSKCTVDSRSRAASSEFITDLRDTHILSNNVSHSKMRIISVGLDGHNEEPVKICHRLDGTEVIGDVSQHLSQDKDAAQVIESVRREEFGLHPGLSNMESSMLKKQHARLGRALHCLSQELYSQDSHFLLELVQNADDNIYPKDVEPTLAFILLDEGIIVLNNERGFSEQNIRALCDVGSSTKKGSTAGYIGQKGIGFKSVFRVTDAPEIHSNGFHVKFDISEGQIGFVLPTLVPPCDVDLFRRLLSSDTDQMGEHDFWNTSIVLPFRSKLSKGRGMKNITSMFSDLHPSLLLFLHRLHCIKFKNTLTDSLIVMKKEIVGDGIIKVSHGKEKMTWYVASQKLEAGFIRPDVQTTEIAIAFTLKETDNGDYSPLLDRQPVFAFLPLRTYGLKFILHGDFVLPSSREEVDGDSPWNQWLLSEFPSLFVAAVRSFCALSCFRENLGKAVAAYMSFVPLVGEVHGFFSSLPRMIISKLRMSNCLLLEGNYNEWVPPCKVLRGWDRQARLLLSDNLLQEHLGLGFLDKAIVLPDLLASALGIEEYGPKTLLQVMTSLSYTEHGLKSMSLGWLCSWLDALYTMLFHPVGQISCNREMELDVINNLQKIPFIPLLDGTYGAVDEGTIWLHSDALRASSDGDYGLEAFPHLSAQLRTVKPALFSVAASDDRCTDVSLVGNLTKMLHKIGVQLLTAHEIVKVQILPALSSGRITDDKNLMTEYLSFVMFHLQSSCTSCHVERDYIMSELHNKAFIMTNYGCKRPVDVSIHFSKEYANPVDVNKFISPANIKWHEVDIAYLKHRVTDLLPSGIIKWRGFFKELGVTDFVHIFQVERSFADVPPTVLKNVMRDGCFVFPDSIIQDWESHELVALLSTMSTDGDKVRSRYLLEVLDMLWDECFSDKVTGYCNLKSNGDIKAFKSSFISSICDYKWVASSMDDELHYPKDLYYDCDTVCSILGGSAPYAAPKVRNEKLLTVIGFKTQVTVDDALAILQLWQRSETPFKASITQMSKFYSFIWNEMAASRQKIMMDFQSGPFIFVPFASGCKHQDIVSGIFLSPEEVYWDDFTGSMNQVKGSHLNSSLLAGNSHPLCKTLCNIYPGLHDFFVNECGVKEIPSFRSYLQFLQQLSAASLPSLAANSVFRVFLEWIRGLRSGLASSEDVAYLRECIVKLDFAVLPTVQDKWVSLHPSFGLVCWCDNEDLRKEFKHFDKIDFLYFGELNSNEKEMLQAELSVLMKTLGIPALSEVVTREAIYYGLADSSLKAPLVNWALPYAQRYIYKMHPNIYSQLKLSGFENLSQLRVLVVEKLFSKNVIKRCDIASKKRRECSSLLEGKFLYTTSESDSHSMFMELSRLFFNGTHELLHLANFLHMIATMAESGSTETQTEFFLLNSQDIPKLPDDESTWSLASTLGSTPAEMDETLASSSCDMPLAMTDDHIQSKPKRKQGIKTSWPPADWKTAPGFDFARLNGFKSRPAIQQPSSSSIKEDSDYDCIVTEDGPPAISMAAFSIPHADTLEKKQRNDICTEIDSNMDAVLEPDVVVPESDGTEWNSSKFGEREQLSFGMPSPEQAILTGRLGELVAFNYFSGKDGRKTVEWMNQDKETGLPYDIVVADKEQRLEYIEVKATRSVRKDWFIISSRELLFALDKGESYSIANVVLSGNKAAKVTIFKNPAKLLDQGKLKLVLMMPKQQKEIPSVS